MTRPTLDQYPSHLQAQIVHALHRKDSPQGSRKDAVLESVAGDGALGEGEAQEGHSGRFLVRVTSFRRRLLDEDNLAEKYHVDCCRYAGLLPSDSPDQTKIETSQVKVGVKCPEYTQIEIEACHL